MIPVFSCSDKCWFISFIYLANYVDKFQPLNILLDIYKYVIPPHLVFNSYYSLEDRGKLAASCHSQTVTGQCGTPKGDNGMLSPCR